MSEEKEEGSHQYMEKYPLGYRFVPYDEELLLYLLWKVKGKFIPPGLIQDADIYECNPFQLSGIDTEEKYTYFFTRRERKYPNGSRTDRSTRDGKGYWKITSKLTPIFTDGKKMGKKNVLVYYLKTPKDQKDIKTNWIMHELELNKDLFPRHAPEEKFSDIIVCRIYDREKGKGDEQRDMVNSLIETKQVMNHNNGEPLRSTKRKFKTNKTIIMSHDPQNVGMKSNYLYNGHELQATAASDFGQTIKTSSADIMSTIMANPIADNHPHQVVQHTHVTGDQNVYLSNNNDDDDDNNNNISSVFPRDVYLSGEQSINSGHHRLVKTKGNVFNDPKLEGSTSHHTRGDESIPFVPENDRWPPSEEFWDGLPEKPPMEDFSYYMDLLYLDIDQTQPKTLL